MLGWDGSEGRGAHSGPNELIPKVISLSFAVLERSTGVDPNLARNRSKLSVQTSIRMDVPSEEILRDSRV